MTHFDFTVIIPSYNREEMLKNVLNDISNFKHNYNINIIIFDDGSQKVYNMENFDVKYIRFEYNHGKQRYWEMVNHIFKYIKKIDSKYFIYLGDDMRLTENFFSECVRLYEKIEDINKICLSIFLDEGRRGKTNWTNFTPINFGEYYQTQWNDMCFMCEKYFFECLNYKISEIPKTRWVNNSLLSSGVGQQISNRLHSLGKKMYHVNKTLVTHGTHDSMMNYEERKINKLV